MKVFDFSEVHDPSNFDISTGENKMDELTAGQTAKPARVQTASDQIMSMLGNLVNRSQNLNDAARSRLSYITSPRPAAEEKDPPSCHEVIPEYYEQLRQKIEFIDQNLKMIENWLDIADIPQGEPRN